MTPAHSLTDPLLEGLSEEQRKAIQLIIDEQVKARMELFKVEESKKTNSNAKMPGAGAKPEGTATPAINKGKAAEVKGLTAGKST